MDSYYRLYFQIWIILLSLLIIHPSYAQTVTLVEDDAPKRFFVPDTTVKNLWRVNNSGFSDKNWITGTGGIGYEKGTGYEQFIQTSVEDLMYYESGSPNRSCYIRIKFNVTSEQIARARRMSLLLRYDDGIVVYINSYEVVRVNAPDNPSFKSLATGEHEAGIEPEEFNVSPFIQGLVAGENLIAIQGLNVAANDPDFLITAKLTMELQGPPPVFESSNLPLVIIYTNSPGIPQGYRIPAHMGVIDNGAGKRNHLADPFNDFDGNISIEVRGSSSSSYEKKSYNFETQDSLGNNLNISLLGLPKENDWILYGPYVDKSLMRDVLMYNISNSMGTYASRSKFCELVLNDEYRGIYILMEKIKRDKNRVKISELDPDDLLGDSLTGGYIIKVDRNNGDEPFFQSPFPPYPGAASRIQYLYHDPDDDEIKEEQKQYIKDFIDKFEAAMDGTDYADQENGYPKFIDEGSFIDHFLLNEICKNVDAFRLSSFLYKERDSKGGKLHAGPIWDMNLSCGNDFLYGCDTTKGWTIEELSLGQDIRRDVVQPPFWWIKLIREPRFAGLIANRWKSLRSGVLEWNNIETMIDDFADTLSEAQERNFTLFPGPGDLGSGYWPVPYIFYSLNTYQDEIDYLKFWLNERMNWMDENIDKLTGVSENKSDILPESFSLLQNYPNPFNPVTVIDYQLSVISKVKLKVYDILGREVDVLVNEEQQPGIYKVQFDARALSSGVYFYRLDAGSFTSIKKMILLR